MTEIKPLYQRRIQDDDWQEIDRSEYVEFSERGKFQTRILYHAAAYESLQKDNQDLRYLNLSSMTDLQIKNRYLENQNAAQAKRIEELNKVLEEITRHFTKTPSSLKDSEIRGKAHAVLAASKNGE